TRVLNGQAEDIGEVKDVIVNTQGTATGFVIGVGGFLGLGDKLVAVPFSSVEVGDVIAGSRVIVVPVTKEQLKAAPTYTSTDPTMADR
ncbi:PRC-barrel domain-containing protein, partial [Acinetobacter baumannii]